MNRQRDGCKQVSDQRTSISSELLKAYSKTEFHVFLEPPVVLKIGVISPPMGDLFRNSKINTAAFLTAFNPFSQAVTDADNEQAQARLSCDLQNGGFEALPGEGQDPEGLWPGEPSFLVLGISRLKAETLGRQFGQNAMVWVDAGLVPELVLLR